jgi:dTDP-4-dehydrorhamnose reductase
LPSAFQTLASTSPSVLVVGAGGQLGAQLLHLLGPNALAAARRPQSPDWLPLDFELIANDPNLLDGLIERHLITSVYCAAGATDVERCESDRNWATMANHLGPLALARAARHIPFVFFSTDYVFDGALEHPGPYGEDAVPSPLSVYGRTKLDGELAVLDAHPSALIIRTTTVYGPDRQAKNFLYTLRRMLNEGKMMRVPTDQLATPTFNTDLAAASIALVEQKQAGVFHIAGPDFLSRYDFAVTACRILNLDTATLFPTTTPELQQKAARPLLAGLNITKLQSVLGLGCMRSVEQGIRDWQAAEVRA